MNSIAQTQSLRGCRFSGRALLCAAILAFAAGGQLGAAGARLFKSGPIQISADGRWVWVANRDNDSVSRIDTSDDSVMEFLLPNNVQGHAPHGLSVAEDGSEVWIACRDSDRVVVLANDGSLLDTIALPWGSGPFSVALSPNQEIALVTLHRGSAVALVDVDSRSIMRVLENLFVSPTGIAWTENGEAAWVTHLFADGEHPSITRIDASGPEPQSCSQLQLFRADPGNSTSLSPPYDIAEGGYLSTRGHPAQIPSATGLNELWLPMQYNNIHEKAYSPDSTVQSTLRRFNLDTRKLLGGNDEKVILSARFIHDPNNANAYVGAGWDAQVSGPIDIAFSVDGSMTYVLHELSNDLVILPSNTPHVKPAGASSLTEVTVGDHPIGLAVSPTTDLAYVVNQFSRDVSVVNLTSASELRRIPVTPTTGEPFSASVLTGAKIFHSSADPRISSNNKVSCASCHLNAEHDGRGWAFHNLPGAHGPRVTPSLLGLRLTMGPLDPATGFGQLHRSGDRDEVQDFEHTFQGANMGGTGFLGASVRPELGAPNAGLSPDLDGLADYLLDLDPIARSPYRMNDGSLSEAAIRGATFFVGSNRGSKLADANCASCHVPETGFVDMKFHDVGSRRPSSEEELNNRNPAWHVNTLTLQGIWTTPPYQGTSSFATEIIDVIEDSATRTQTSTPHGSPDGLTPLQMRDLEEFIQSIDGNTTAAEVRGARDTSPPRVVRVEVASLDRINIWFNEGIDSTSAEDLANWRLEEVGAGEIAITSLRMDSINEDRLLLRANLAINTSFRLLPLGGIHDLADRASNGVANVIDASDSDNAHVFDIGESLTITLGDSGYENLTIRVHDGAMAGPGLATWNHDSIWLFPVNRSPGVNTGFLRFDWRNVFAEATGIASAQHIIEATPKLFPTRGDVQRIEFRRALQSWSDPIGGKNWNSSPTGGTTWRHHSYPSQSWNIAGARALGGTGANPADYNAAYDLSARVDATVNLVSIKDGVSIRSLGVTEAYQFWFDHPGLDYGHAIRLAAGATSDLMFPRSGRRPILEITYSLTDASPITRETIVDAGDIWKFFRGVEAPPTTWNEPGFDDDWEEGPTGIGYGDGDDATILNDMRCVGNDPCAGGYLAFFARREFQVSEIDAVFAASLQISFDDGFVAYVNGRELGRVNVPAGSVNHLTAANATVGDAPNEPDAVLDIPLDFLVEGTNVVAVSVHNTSLSSSDVSFIPRLEIVRRESSGNDVRFIRANCNDDRSVDISDAISTLESLFLGGRAITCQDACDSNDDGAVDISDAITTLRVLFLGSGVIPPPGRVDCGVDPTDDRLGCATRPKSCV